MARLEDLKQGARVEASVTVAVGDAAFGAIKPDMYRRVLAILAELDRLERVGVAQLAGLTDSPKRTTQRDLAFLKRAQMVRFVGAKKTGGYEITDAGRREVRKGLAR